MSDQQFNMPEFPLPEPQNDPFRQPFPQDFPIPEVPPVPQAPERPGQSEIPQQMPEPPRPQQMQTPNEPVPQQPPVPPQPPVQPEKTVTVCRTPHTMDDFAPDTIRMLSLPRISQSEAESCRHRLEKPWYRRLVILNIFLILMTFVLVISSYDDYQKQVQQFSAQMIAEMTADSSEDDSTESEKDKTEKADYEDFAEEIPLGFKMLGYGLAIAIIGYLALYSLNAQVRAKSVKVTERNFPEVHALIHSFSDRLGIQAPEAYIVSENGILNAFSAYLFRRQYIQINSEVFEVAYREHRDMNALAFVIAHEISHIYYGHATLHYNAWIWFSERVPLFAQIASRTREYSCDRLAQRLTNYDGIGAMLMLMVDRHMYYMVDVQDYLNNAAREGGFFLWLHNLFADHPIMTKRIRALAEWTGSGELY